MLKRKASAKWEGTLMDGKGTMQYGSYTGNFSFTSRFKDGEGTNPEELIAAAHAGCFSMAFNVEMERAGFSATFVETNAIANFEKLEKGWRITEIVLKTQAQVPGISNDEFQRLAEVAKTNCPVSNALSVPIRLEATLTQ